jgi:hypothetical protein
MKCDKLKSFIVRYNGKFIRAYEESEVDSAIAELKAKLEDVQATAYADSVDAGMENRRMKRALWLARSRRAFAEARYNNQIARRYDDRNEKTIAECYDKEVAKWKNSDRKCRAKAEQYL